MSAAAPVFVRAPAPLEDLGSLADLRFLGFDAAGFLALPDEPGAGADAEAEAASADFAAGAGALAGLALLTLEDPEPRVLGAAAAFVSAGASAALRGSVFTGDAACGSLAKRFFALRGASDSFSVEEAVLPVPLPAVEDLALDAGDLAAEAASFASGFASGAAVAAASAFVPETDGFAGADDGDFAAASFAAPGRPPRPMR